MIPILLLEDLGTDETNLAEKILPTGSFLESERELLRAPSHIRETAACLVPSVVHGRPLGSLAASDQPASPLVVKSSFPSFPKESFLRLSAWPVREVMSSANL